MDPLSIGAGAVAFITVAVQSAKIILDIISSIQDSPKHLRDVARDIDQLHGILGQLLRCRSLPKNDNPDLATLLRRCSEDISLYARRMGKLRIAPKERQTGKLWKRLVAVFSERDIQTMKSTIHGHVSSLGLQLSVMQVDLVWESRVYLQALTTAMALHSPLAPEPGILPASSCHCAQPTVATRRDAGLKAVTDTRSTRQTAYFGGLIHLPLLLHAENQILQSSDARAVVDGLEKLLYSALEHMSSRQSQSPHHSAGGLVPVPGSGFRPDIQAELKLIWGLITSSRQIIVNQPGPAPRSRLKGEVIDQQRKRERITMDDGLLMLTSLKRSRVSAAATANTSSHTHFKAAGQEFLGTVTFFPANPLSSLMIIASVHQEEVRGGLYCETPRLCVSRLLPSDAPVFQLAREGRVSDLQALVSQGKASLRDRDINGMSLLHYSVGHPSLCRFLIDHGADVNEIAGKNDQAESLPLLAATTRATTSARDSPEFAATKASIEVLLRAGADPTISLKSWDSPFHIACTPKDIDIFDIFLELGSAFAHINLADARGQTPLLRMCSWYSTYTRHMFSHLVDQGADIHARDNTGATCLHLAIENAKRPLSDEFEALAYLVRRGADVYATTSDGISVSEVAYTTSSTDVVYKLGSYRGDLWDAVLANAGYDVLSFRNHWPREGFTDRYTHADFEKLWKGQQHLCPYFKASSPAVPEVDDSITEVETPFTTVTRRRSLETCIKQRTDISVTIESMEELTLHSSGNAGATGEEHPPYDRYEGSCVASHSLFTNPPTHQAHVPLLWDPSLVHHLMPNPWHDIIPPQEDPGGASLDVAPGAEQSDGGSLPNVYLGNQNISVGDQLNLSNGKEAGHDVGKSCWDGIEMENVWGK